MKNIKIIITLLAFFLAMFFGFKNNAKAVTSYDLKADSFSLTSAKCEINQVCNFTAKVKNLGNEFTLNFPLKSTVSGDGYKTDSQTGVSPSQGAMIRTNDYITFFISGLFTKIGSVALTFAVDPAGFLTESSTANNSVGLTVSVSGYDLAAESLTISPASPMVNQNCYIRVAVKNSSSYNLYTRNGLDVIRNLPDFSLTASSSTEPSLAHVIYSGGYLYWGYEGKFTASGEKTLSFTVDSDNALAENSLTNNTIVKKINVYNASDTDLAIDSVIFSATKIILGTPLDLTIGVKNIGKTSLTDATGFSKVELSFNLPNFDYGINDPVADVYPTLNAPFNPADIFHYKFHGTFNKPGTFNLNFIVNKDKQLTEATLANDATTTPVRVYTDLAEADSFSIIAKSVSLVSSTTAIINWQTDLNTTGILNYNQAHYNVSDNTINVTSNVTDHAVTLNKLRPDVNYIYMITARNGTAEKVDMLNSFLMPADDFLRITTSPSISVSDKNVTFNWATNLISSSRVYYKKSGVASVTLAGVDTMTAEHKVEIKDLTDGFYDYFLSSTSTPGTNYKTSWASFEIKATVSAPTTATSTPPAASNPAVASSTSTSFSITNDRLYERLKGKIILKVQSKGEAYYISPKEKKMYYLGKPEDAFQVIRSQAVGFTNINLAKIPVGLNALSGTDTDNDGLPDAFETAIGTDPKKSDTDADGFSDKDEITAGYSPLEKNKKSVFDNALMLRFKGGILLQVEGRGEAWYINPADGKRYFLARAADAFSIMRKLGLGVTNADYAALGGK